MKQMLPRLWGNDALRARIGNDIRAHRLSHAYILDGKYGMGKHTLALQIAAAQSCLCKDDPDLPLPCGTCKNCKKILEGKSPDVILISREKGKTQMTVDVIRKLRTDVLTAPNDLDTKVYIIEDAHTMNPQAQNALLLTLEEPPAYVLFLLLCEDAGNMLETIRSRAPIYRLQPLSPDVISQYVTQSNKGAASGETLREVLMAAEGSIGKALDLLSPKESAPILAARETALAFLEAADTKGVSALDALNAFGSKRDEVSLRMQTLVKALRDLIAIKKCDPATVSLCFFTDHEQASAYAMRFSVQELIKWIAAVESANDSITIYNANVRIVLWEMFRHAGILS
jgi:DNA polymerase-3 subunit delta'